MPEIFIGCLAESKDYPISVINTTQETVEIFIHVTLEKMQMYVELVRIVSGSEGRVSLYERDDNDYFNNCGWNIYNKGRKTLEEIYDDVQYLPSRRRLVDLHNSNNARNNDLQINGVKKMLQENTRKRKNDKYCTRISWYYYWYITYTKSKCNNS